MSTELDQLAFALECAKQAEIDARNARLAAEDALIAAVGCKDEGTISAKTDWYKISVTQSIERKIKPEALGILDEQLDPAIFGLLLKPKPPELNVSEYKKLATANPEAYRIAASVVIAKPSKPSVKVERIEMKSEAV